MAGQFEKDSLGNRMKSAYEKRAQSYLPRRTNTILRLDGKAFHSYTKGLKRPYDLDFMSDMDQTAKYLCENVVGCRLAYVQSDEISLLLTDYQEIGTEAWFDGNIQKMCSISASLATAKFNQVRLKRRLCPCGDNEGMPYHINNRDFDYNLAQFDARVYTIPELIEVHNYFVWRQQDATKNSIQMAAQSMFPHSQLQNLNCNQLQEKMWVEKVINWNDYPASFKRGRVIVKTQEVVTHDKSWNGTTFTGDAPETSYRTKWSIQDPPIFTQDKDFVSNQVLKVWKQLNETPDV